MKKILAFILTAAMIMTFAACGAAQSPADNTLSPSADSEAAALLTFTVTVVHADGSEKEFTYETDEEYVGPVLVEAGLIKGNDGPYGLEITEVDGETAIYATDGAYWAIYEGDTYAKTGIDKVEVTAGGSYTLKYERG